MALEEAVSEADQTLRETGHLIPKPSSLGRKACCDVELGGRLNSRAQVSEDNMSDIDGGTSSAYDWRPCLWECLGPIFGWLGFSFLDGWWPERQLNATDKALYQVQQEELRCAVLSFGSSQSHMTIPEMKAMFYFADCQSDGRAFISFFFEDDDFNDESISVDDILEAFGRWPSHISGRAAAGG